MNYSAAAKCLNLCKIKQMRMLNKLYYFIHENHVVAPKPQKTIIGEMYFIPVQAAADTEHLLFINFATTTTSRPSSSWKWKKYANLFTK